MLIRLSAFLFAGLTFIACSSGGASPGTDASTGDDAATDASSECDGQAEGAPCEEGRICLTGECVDSVCGDGFVDVQRGEECDDGNFTDGDGCDLDCTLSCHSNADCDNGNDCDGTEACVSNARGQRCQKNPPVPCPAPSGACGESYCDPNLGTRGECVELTRSLCFHDADDDGYPDELDEVEIEIAGVGGECFCPAGYMPRREDGAWDCNDARADVHPGATGYHAVPHCLGQEADAISVPCEGPGCLPFECANGASPSFDYDCDGQAALRFDKRGPSCVGTIFACSGGGGWVTDPPPTCGESATFRSECKGLMGIGCSGPEAPRVQECR